MQGEAALVQCYRFCGGTMPSLADIPRCTPGFIDFFDCSRRPGAVGAVEERDALKIIISIRFSGRFDADEIEDVTFVNRPYRGQRPYGQFRDPFVFINFD